MKKRTTNKKTVQKIKKQEETTSKKNDNIQEKDIEKYKRIRGLIDDEGPDIKYTQM